MAHSARRWTTTTGTRPTFMESMMATVLESHRSVCRPTVAFLTPFLFFEVARWEIRQSHWRNAPGATLLFSRDAWEMRPFRPLFQDEDVWFHLDQDRCGSTMVPVIALESFLAVRHRGSIRDRGHVWTHQQDGSTLEDDLKQRELHSRQPEDLLPEFAVNVYRELRQDCSLPLDEAAAVAIHPIKRPGHGLDGVGTLQEPQCIPSQLLAKICIGHKAHALLREFSLANRR